LDWHKEFGEKGIRNMSNFDFLKSYSRKLARAGSDAESILYLTPSMSSAALRYLAEKLAIALVEKRRLRMATGDKDNATFHKYIIAIRDARVAPTEIVNDFFDIKNTGNGGVHEYDVELRDAKELLVVTHRLASWFMLSVIRSREAIPPFVMPEPPIDGAPPSTNIPLSLKFLGTPAGRWTAIILGALGITFGYFMFVDEEHRPNAALMKTMHIVVFVLVLALLALPLFILANGITIWQAYHLFVSSIADKIGWSEYLIRALGLVLLLPFFSAVRLSFSLNAKRRLTGMAALIAMAVGYNLMFYYATKDTPFTIGNGHASKYFERTDQGIVFFDRPGYSPTTGQPLLQVTPDVWREYKIELKQGTDSMTSVDPAAHDWFNPNTGAPMLWYSRPSEGKFDFFPRPGTNPRTGDPLAPVTRDLYQTWVAAHTPKAPKPVTQEDILSQILRPAASGGPGVLLLDTTANDQGGVDALNRHLAGVNTSAFPAEVLERRGFAGKFYQGDASLVRKALAITRLNTLVIAEVKTDCAKKSSLDSDLLSCNLTANARRFDAQGNPAGTQLVQATGAGFNESAALEEAGKRASTSLLAFAKR
jgi:hypothetical protein